MAYSRARANWVDFPSETTIVRAQDLNQWDQAIYELKALSLPAPSGDTTGAADWAAFNTVLTSAPPSSASGATYLIPPGSYYFNAHLPINYTTRLIGSGMGSSDHVVSSATKLTFTSNTDDGFRVFAGGCTFRDFAMIGSSSALSGSGMRIDYAGYMVMERVGFRGFYDSVSISTGIYWQLLSSYFLTPTRYGVRVQNTEVADAGDGLIGNNCVFLPRTTGSTAAIRWETGGGLKVQGCKINLNGAGLWAYGVDASIADAATTSVLLIQNNSIENLSTTGVSVTQQGTTGLFGKVQISGNEFGPSGGMPTCVSVVSTTTGNITDVSVTDNYLSGTVNAVLYEGVTGGIIGGNNIIGTFTESAIGLHKVSNIQVAPNKIDGAFTNAAVNIKSSATPSSAVSVEHQAVFTSSASQTIVLDSSATVASSLKRNRVVYDEMREIPAGMSTTYATMYELLLPGSLGAGGVLTFSVAGLVTGGTLPDAFAIYGQRLLTCPKAASSNVTTATIGADVTAGTAVDYQLLCTTAATAKLQIRLNAAQGGTGMTGQVRVKYNGVLQRLIRV